MIRINLAPARQTRRKETVQQQLLSFAGVIILTIFACAAWSAYVSNEKKEKVATIEQKNQELAQLDKIIGEVNQHTAKKKELQDKLDIIERLKKGKTGPVRALDDLATEIPKRVWLTTFSESGGNVTFSGTAMDHEDVSSFMKALQKSKYFTNIVLQFSEKTTSGYGFSITCTVNYAA